MKGLNLLYLFIIIAVIIFTEYNIMQRELEVSGYSCRCEIGQDNRFIITNSVDIFDLPEEIVFKGILSSLVDSGAVVQIQDKEVGLILARVVCSGIQQDISCVVRVDVESTKVSVVLTSHQPEIEGHSTAVLRAFYGSYLVADHMISEIKSRLLLGD